MESGRASGLASRQDCTQFEDALRRLYALELKLTDQVQIDIRELRQKWILPRVDRVTTNTFKLYQVREQLKKSKVLFLEEERILEEFKSVKLQLKEKSMGEEEFDATRETCMLLGGKLMDIRAKQHRCYSDNSDLEMVINRDIMAIRFEDKDFEQMDVEQVRASTPLRKLSPTPLDRHRSREPSPFCMPKLKLGSGTITPGGSKPPDPHTYFSRSSSSQSLHQGGGGFSTQLDFDSFRAAMEAKQAEDDSLPQTTQSHPTYSHSMRNLSFKGPHQSKQASNEHLCPEGMFSIERPSSAMSEMSIHVGDHDVPSRAESRMENVPLGDAISQGNLNIHSSFSSVRGSEQQAIGKSIASWMSKLEDDDDFMEDEYSKHPVEETFDRLGTPKAEDINYPSRNEMTPKYDPLVTERSISRPSSKAQNICTTEDEEIANLSDVNRLGKTETNDSCYTKESSQWQANKTIKSEPIESSQEKVSSRSSSANKIPEVETTEPKWQSKTEPVQKKEQKSTSRPASVNKDSESEANDKKPRLGSVNKGSDSKDVEEEPKRKPWEAKPKTKAEEEKEEKAASRPGSVNKSSDSKEVEETPKRKPWQAKPKTKPEEEKEEKAASRPGSVNKGSDSKEVEEKPKRKQWQPKTKPEEEKEGEAISRPGSVNKEHDTKEIEEEPLRKPWQAKQKTKQEEEKEQRVASRPGSVNRSSDYNNSNDKPPSRPSSKTATQELEENEITKPLNRNKTPTNEQEPRPKSRNKMSTVEKDEVDSRPSRSNNFKISKSSESEPLVDEHSEETLRPRSRNKTPTDISLEDEDLGFQRPKSREWKTSAALNLLSSEESQDEIPFTEDEPILKSSLNRDENLKDSFRMLNSRTRKISASGKDDEDIDSYSKTQGQEENVPRPNSRARKISTSKLEEEIESAKTSSRNKSNTKEGNISRPNSRARKVSTPKLDEDMEFASPSSKNKSSAEEGNISRPNSRTRKASATNIEAEDNALAMPASKDKVKQKEGKSSRPQSRNKISSTEDCTVLDKSDIVRDQSIAESNQETYERKRTFSSSSGFEQLEPAEWNPEEHDEDELMIILDDNYGLEDVAEEDEEYPEKHPLGMMSLQEHNVDPKAMEELEMQYQLESSKQGSRPSSSLERPPSILKGSREASKERTDGHNVSRPGSRSSFQDRKKISFDDDFQPELPMDSMEIQAKSRSQSKERPGSRSSMGSMKDRHSIERKKSASLVPELETIDIPASLKEKLESIEHPQEYPRRHSTERQDSPRPSSRPPSRPPSTGYTHLDEFERKLAEMETELETEEKTRKGHERTMNEGHQNTQDMWNLVENEVNKEKLFDGYYLNKEEELGNLDHSMIVGQAVEDELKSKKVSFAASDERYEIQRPGEVKTMGKNLYSLSPPKPMRKLPGKEGEEEADANTDVVTQDVTVEKEQSKGIFSSLSRGLTRSRSKTPDTEKESGSFFGSLLRKGKRGSRSASRQSSVDRDSQDIGSDMEGRLSRASDAGSENSLVMKIKSLGRKKQHKVSTTDFDELFARGRAMSAMYDSDTEVKDEKKISKSSKQERILQAQESIDYNEKVTAFLEDQVKREEKRKSRKDRQPKIEKRIVESNIEEKIKDLEPTLIPERKISTYSKPEDIKLSPVTKKKDPFTGKQLPQSPDEEFLAKITDFVVNYSQKPNYEQVWPASPTKPKRTERRKIKMEANDEKVQVIDTPRSSVFTDEINSNSNIPKTVETSLIENQTAAADCQGQEVTSPSEIDFLDKVSSFVTQYTDQDDYSQKIWPTKEQMSSEPKTKKTMSPGRSYLEHKGEVEWFARSIEADSFEAQQQLKEMNKTKKSKEPTPKNSLSSGAALMRQHMSSTKEASNNKRLIAQEPESPLPEPPGRKSKFKCASQPPPELSPSVIPKPGLRSSSSQSQISNQEFYTKLIMGLQKYTTPEPESRSAAKNSTNSIQEIQSKSVMNTNEKSFSPENQNIENKNLDFYDKLVTGLKVMTNDQEQDVPKESNEGDIYRKYSHHLGRAEFGTLKRRESTGSNVSNLKYSHSFSESKDTNYDKINTKLSLSRKVSRQDSGEKYVRGQSRMSDTSEAMPDLEVEYEIESEMLNKMERKSTTPVIARGSSVGPTNPSTSNLSIPLPEVSNKRDDALQNVAEQKQKIKAIKEKIQNGLMTVVGFGVMAYLTTLDSMTGGGG